MKKLAHRALVIGFLAAAALIAAVYYPGLSGSFLFDDTGQIVNNSAIHLDRLTLSGLANAWSGFNFGLFGRPLPMISLAIDHSLWGLNPFGYKLTNLIIHLVNAAGLAWLGNRLLMLGHTGSEPRKCTLPILALFLMLFWAVHPLQVSTVLYAVQRMELLGATFIILGLAGYVAGRQRQVDGRTGGWPLLSTVPVCMALAVLSKETGLLLPGYALVLELALFGFRSRRGEDTAAVRTIWAVAVLAAVAVYALYFWPEYTSESAYSGRDFTWQERLLTQLRIMPMYLGQILWPAPQNYLFYYDSITASKSLLEPPATVFGGLLLSALAITAFILRRRVPLFFLGIMWFFVSHALTSNIAPLELAFEHRNYLAVFGVLLAITALLMPVAKALSPGFLRAGGLTVIAFVSFLTLLTTATWGNPLELSLAFQKRNPDSERAHYGMGLMYRRMANGSTESPFFSMAEAAYKRAAALEGSSPLPEHALIGMHAYSGKPAEPELWDRLIEKVESGPLGAEQIRSVRLLLAKHNQGDPIDADRLMDAGIALLNKPGLTPSVNFEFALLALDSLDDEKLAVAILNAGAARSGDPAWPQMVRDALIERGHGAFARRWWQSRDNSGLRG